VAGSQAGILGNLGGNVHKEHERHAAHLNLKNYPPAMRVLPVEETVDSQSQILDIDSAAEVFRKARVISAVECACRLQAKKTVG